MNFDRIFSFLHRQNYILRARNKAEAVPFELNKANT